jgi:3-dehydroquinate synthase
VYELEIASRSENYKVFIGVSTSDVANDFDFAIIDKNVAGIAKLEMPTYFVTAIEANKTLTEVEAICLRMSEAGVARSSRVLAIGGGIVQDLATLASSIYMRGVRWSYIPTTLTGMADSCLGGKSSINVGNIKNLVGNIHPPESIFIDTAYLETLPDADLVSGLAEAVKICFAKGGEEFETYLANLDAFSPGNTAHTQTLIHHSLSCKKWFIEIDEFDRAERQLLNFGHTFGHALEAATDFKIPHGIGVAVGMVAANNHPKAVKSEAVENLISYCNRILDSHRESLAVANAAADWNKFERAMRGDKKNTKDSLCLVLPSGSTGLTKTFLPYTENPVEEARAVLQQTLHGLAQGTK